MRVAPSVLVVVGWACAAPPASPDAGATGDTCTVQLGPSVGLRLLTRAEYDRTVGDLLGLTVNASRDFPREPLSPAGLDNSAALLRVSADGVSQYLVAAESLAAAALDGGTAGLVPCSTPDATCGLAFITSFGQRAFRRPLLAVERDAFSALFGSALASTSFPTAVEWTVAAMLQSPQFLYRDETPAPQGPLTSSLGSFARASRLSYFLWGTTPDDELLQAAASGALDTPAGLTAQATRMLADPRAIDGLMRFFSLWLQLDAVTNVEKNTSVYPRFTPQLAAAWRTSLELYLTDVLTTDGTLTGLLSRPVLYANDTMRGMYGVPAHSPAFVKNEMAGAVRAGILTQPGFLALKAMPDSSSPVRRGIFVLDRLLCQSPPPPPAAFTPPQPTTSATTRERFAQHSQNPGCAGCHRHIDPVGFVFENYDGVGTWRDTENGLPVDASGGIVSAEDESLVAPVSSVAELELLLARSPQVHACLSREMYAFALGRELAPADTCAVQHIARTFQDSGGAFKALMLAVVQSPGFVGSTTEDTTP